MLAPHITDKELSFRIHKNYYKSIKRPFNQEKMAKDIKRHFTEVKILMAFKHIKTCSAPLLIKYIQA